MDCILVHTWKTAYEDIGGTAGGLAMTKQILVVFDTKPTHNEYFAAHPTEASKDYQMPKADEDREDLLPIGTMSHNDDGSWTIRLSSRPSGNTLVAKPLA
jgi:hypothetical protein